MKLYKKLYLVGLYFCWIAIVLPAGGVKSQEPSPRAISQTTAPGLDTSASSERENLDGQAWLLGFNTKELQQWVDDPGSVPFEIDRQIEQVLDLFVATEGSVPDELKKQATQLLERSRSWGNAPSTTPIQSDIPKLMKELLVSALGFSRHDLERWVEGDFVGFDIGDRIDQVRGRIGDRELEDLTGVKGVEGKEQVRLEGGDMPYYEERHLIETLRLKGMDAMLQEMRQPHFLKQASPSEQNLGQLLETLRPNDLAQLKQKVLSVTQNFQKGLLSESDREVTELKDELNKFSAMSGESTAEIEQLMELMIRAAQGSDPVASRSYLDKIMRANMEKRQGRMSRGAGAVGAVGGLAMVVGQALEWIREYRLKAKAEDPEGQ
jgi:hypothetical protein